MNESSQAELADLRQRLADLEAAHARLRRVLAQRTAETDDALEHLSSILDSMSDAVIVADPDHKIRLLNPAVTEFFDVSPMILGQDLAEHLPAIDALLRSREGGAPTSGEVVLAGARVGRAVVNSISGSQTGRSGAVIVIRDTTEQQEVDRMKTAFIANISHELRTPVTSIAGFATLAQRRVAALLPRIEKPTKREERHMAQALENLDIVATQSAHLTELIDRVIDFASLEAGRMAFHPEPCALHELLSASADAHTPKLGPGVSLQRAIAPSEPASADPARIRQVLDHLIDNAIKFTTKGSVTVGTRSGADWVEAWVSDTGIGIPADRLQAVFQPFDQAGDQLTEKPAGTGLGLPFCRAVAERHGGTLVAESEPGAGTTITLRLPR